MFPNLSAPGYPLPWAGVLSPYLEISQWDPLPTETQASHILLTSFPVLVLMPESEEKEDGEDKEQ